MAHEVSFNVPERGLGKAAIEFKVRHDGVVIGRLKVSKGAIEWVARDKSNGHKLAWREFALIMQARQERSLDKSNQKPSPHKTVRPHGVKTPQEAFRIPILRLLHRSNGSARARQIRGDLENCMDLNAYDKAPLRAARPDVLRWWKTAQWERYTMVQDGLLSHETPKGIWEITDAGRRVLANAQKA